MLRYIIKRILGIIPVLWVVATLTFFLIRLAPGGPFDSDKQIPKEILANLEAKYHLDEPLIAQYFRYLGMLAQGDLGPSFRYASRTVNEIIGETFPVSAAIGFSRPWRRLSCLLRALRRRPGSANPRRTPRLASGNSVAGQCITALFPWRFSPERPRR